jgi:hypothetical protein
MFDIIFFQKQVLEIHRSRHKTFESMKVNYQNIFYNYNLPLHRPQVAPATKTTG